VGELISIDTFIRIWLDSGATASLDRRDMWNNKENCFIAGPQKRVLGDWTFSDYVSEFTIKGFPGTFAITAYLVDLAVLKGGDLLLGSDVIGSVFRLLAKDSDSGYWA
jgi:hypothetical protein